MYDLDYACINHLIIVFSVLIVSIIAPPLNNDKGLSLFHSSDYVKFLKSRDVSSQLAVDNEREDDEEYGIGISHHEHCI